MAGDQELLARLVHAMRGADPAAHLAILQAAHTHFLAGGARRLRHTLPPLCFSALRAVRGAAREAAPPPPALDAWFQLLHAAISSLASIPGAEPAALQLHLAAAAAASEEAGLELVAYEFFEQAFTLYEEGIPDSRAEIRALHAIAGTLHRCRVFGGDNREALAHKASSYCAKLLKRYDQCLAVLACSHLHWQEEGGPAAAGAGEERDGEGGGGAAPGGVRDAAGVLSCLKRALRVANAAQQQLAVAARAGADAAGPAFLYVEILNRYLYFFDRGVDLVTPAVLQVHGPMHTHRALCVAVLSLVS